MEQYVVRCDDIRELVESIALVKEAMKEQREEEHAPDLPEEQSQPVPEEAQQATFCFLHQKAMKRRTATSGKIWYDHRWQDRENKQWHTCNGKTVTIQEQSTSASSS
jgi:hypothetical protein